MVHHPGVPSLALRSFPALKELSWAGLSTHEYDSLAPALRQCAPRLTKLELDPEWHEYLTEDYMIGSRPRRTLPFFSKKVLRLHRPGSLVFPALKTLSLSNVDLNSHNFAIARSIDFANLENLQLRFCPGTERVLQHLAASGSSKLRTLEINLVYSYSPLPAKEQQTIWIAFLESFEGLEELYINISNEAAGLTTGVWRAVGRHRKTLRQFGYHQRQHFTGAYGNGELQEEAFGENGVSAVDALNVGLSETADLEGDGSNNPLCQLDLRGLGLGCSPKLMMPIVSPFCHKSSLQLLHMRRSGLDSILEDPDDSPIPLPIYKTEDVIRSELHPFLQWVFGPRGIRSLQLFVYGDFSHGGRYRRYWKVMCRNETPEAAAAAGDAETRFYREVTEDDQGLWGLLKEHEGLVSALPNDGLFGGYHPDPGGAQ
ncbi:hypothetical protein PG985_007941 [Apiospora marii]|uniref:uncharacterized protein n=1 Tax=Apiospora marii TaxID=335849 RepID=UPI0031327E05